jgi:hypothetical protein
VVTSTICVCATLPGDKIVKEKASRMIVRKKTNSARFIKESFLPRSFYVVTLNELEKILAMTLKYARARILRVLPNYH